ncbi:TPA: glycosyltransferase [Bacillus cereus]|nr:glycosyltransferase [Bacillus cereus]
MKQPLVSILIPVTGNASYLELSLTSVLLQTYSNIEIIIRDPTPTDQIQIFLEKEFLPYSNKITYIKSTNYMNRLEVLQELLGLSKGSYINFLLEGDLFYPTKIEEMMNYFMKDLTNSIKLITSNIAYIDIHGNQIDKIDEIQKTDAQWNNILSSNLILKHPNSGWGLSTPLFRKKDLIQPFGCFAGHQFIKEIGVASWLTLVSKGSCRLIAEELTFERKNIDYKINMDLITDWINLLRIIQPHNFGITQTTKSKVIKKISGWIDYLLSNKHNMLTLIEREKIHEYKEYLYKLQTTV